MLLLLLLYLMRNRLLSPAFLTITAWSLLCIALNDDLLLKHLEHLLLFLLLSSLLKSETLTCTTSTIHGSCRLLVEVARLDLLEALLDLKFLHLLLKDRLVLLGCLLRQGSLVASFRSLLVHLVDIFFLSFQN